MRTNTATTSILLTLSFPSWITLVSTILFFYTSENPFYLRTPDSRIFYTQILAYAIFGLLVVAARFNMKSFVPFAELRGVSPQAVITLFFIISFFRSAFSEDQIRPTAYVILTFGAFVLSSNSWSGNHKIDRHVFSIATLSLSSVFVLLFLFLGYERGRTIGGITPNHIGQLCFVIAVCSMIANKWIRIIGIVVAIIGIVIVNSRSGALAGFVFFALYTVLPPFRGIFPIIFIRLIFIIFLFVLSGLVSILLQDSALGLFTVDWLKIYHPVRGFGTGLTGRVGIWAIAYEKFLESPIFGHGFRYPFRTHSGYLALLLQTGIVGTAMFMFAASWHVAKQMILATSENYLYEDRLIAKVGVCFVATNFLVLWVIEPNYISLGFPTQLLLIYFLAKNDHNIFYYYTKTYPRSPQRIAST